MNCRGLIGMNVYNRSSLLRVPFSPAIAPRVTRFHCRAQKPVTETQLDQSIGGEGVRCVVNEEGHLVCERLDPGDYVVRSADVVSEEVEGSQTFCYITDDGQLLCEGLQSGEYTIEKATDDDVESMLAHVESLAKEESVTQEVPTATEEKPEALAQAATENENDGVRCFVTEEGHMVCERLPPGDYKVKTAPTADGAKAKDSEEVVGSGTFCYITDDGQLICEGLESGEYTIEEATDEDMEAMLAHVESLGNETAVAEKVPAATEVKPEALAQAAPVESVTENENDGVRCFVTEEGHMVCERLPPGDYKVKTAPTADGAKAKDSEEVVGSGTFCYITDDGQLICEGLESGEYTIEEATDEDMEAMLAHVESLGNQPAVPEVKKSAVMKEVPAATEEKPEALAQEAPVETSEPAVGDENNGVRCFVTEEGQMVCERLAPGLYEVKSSADGRTTKASEEVVGKGTFCYVTDDGQLICEGLPEGNYTIKEAGEEDMEAMLKALSSA